MKKRFVLATIIIAFLFIASYSPLVLADGMIIPPIDYRVYESGQKAVIFHDGKKETLILQVSFKGDAKDFAWIVPVPSKPEVDKGQDSLFTALEKLTRPKQQIFYDKALPGVGGGGGAAESQVSVIETKKVDIYDIQVLTSTDSKALVKWFGDNNYPYPEHASYILNSYINNHWFFVAAKVSTEALGSMVADQLKEGHATPLKISFDTEKIVYPLRISSVLAQESDNPPKGQPKETEWKEFKGNLYKRIWTGTESWDEARTACTSQGADLTSITNSQEDDFVRNLCGEGNICRLGHQNPGGYCQRPFVSWVDGEPFSYENWAPGEPQFACSEDCLDLVYQDKYNGKWNNSWCYNPYEYKKFSICKKSKYQIQTETLGINKFVSNEINKAENEEIQSRQIIDNSPPSDFYLKPRPSSPKTKYVDVTLYIFSDHKKEIPNFDTQYANFVKPKDIEKLAQTDIGNPWIKTTKKMYLTKLYRNMATSQMTEDLFPQNASDNKKVPRDTFFFWDFGWDKAFLIILPLLFELAVIAIIFFKRGRS